MVEITCVVEAKAELGEGTLWDPKAGVLWWIDIWKKLIHRYNPATGKDDIFETPEYIGCLGVREKGGLVMTMAIKSPTAQATEIVKTPGVCGGSACVRTTRIPVWSLVSWRRQGVFDERLLEMYPTLNQSDLNAAWTYADGHHDEIEKDIKENEDA